MLDNFGVPRLFLGKNLTSLRGAGAPSKCQRAAKVALPQVSDPIWRRKETARIGDCLSRVVEVTL